MIFLTNRQIYKLTQAYATGSAIVETIADVAKEAKKILSLRETYEHNLQIETDIIGETFNILLNERTSIELVRSLSKRKSFHEKLSMQPNSVYTVGKRVSGYDIVFIHSAETLPQVKHHGADSKLKLSENPNRS